jgi:predicted permease
MTSLREFFQRLRGTGRYDHARIDAELELHYELEVDQLIAKGVPRLEAERQARINTGGDAQMRELYRDQQTLPLIDSLWQDVKFAVRILARNRGLTASALLTLALGIGANAALFSVVSATFLQPLPYPRSEQLVVVRENHPEIGDEEASMPNYIDFRNQSTSFQDLAATASANATVTGGEAEVVRAAVVSDNFFRTMGVAPRLGRWLGPEDRDARRVVVSSGFWQRRLGSAPNVAGQVVQIDGEPYEVAGVMPSTFQAPSKAQLWIPFRERQRSAGRRADFLTVIGRLKDGTGLEAASSELKAIAGRLAVQYPETNARWSIHAMPLRQFLFGEVKTALLVLSGAVFLLLLIACVNVMNLQLARGAARSREMMVRSALGAGSGRLRRQLIVESLVLSFAGGALGILLALVALQVAQSSLASLLPYAESIRIDWRVAAFAGLLMLASGLSFGLAPLNVPALAVPSPQSRTGMSRGHRRLLEVLVAGEVALALTLLVGAGLLARSLYALTSADLGFRSDGVVAIRMGTLTPSAYPNSSTVYRFYETMLERVSVLPGVKQAAFATMAPLQGFNSNTFELRGQGNVGDAHIMTVSPGYFDALGIPIRQGRNFDRRDGTGGAPVAIINEALARRYFKDDSPIGKEIQVDATWHTIVGVKANVANAAPHQITEPEEILVPLPQRPQRSMTLLIRAEGDHAPLVPAIREVVRSINPNQPLARVATQQAIVDDALLQPRLSAILMGSFALVGLLLAIIGVYGVMSYSVEQRTAELGLRMAIGASPGQLRAMVLRGGLVMTLAGIFLGLVGATLLANLLGSLLYQTRPLDPQLIGILTVIFLAITTLACYLPARRATRLDPSIALRAD